MFSFILQKVLLQKTDRLGCERTQKVLNVGVEWQGFFVCIRKDSVQNSAWRTAAMNWVLVFLSPSQQMLRHHLKFGHNSYPPHLIQVFILNHTIIRCHVILAET